MKNFVLAWLLCVVCCPILVGSQEIRVAAASDLQFVFTEVAARFEKQSGDAVRLSFGSSGNFFSQLQNGAPFDLFFSADIQYPQRLQDAGFGEPGALYSYARGKIVLWLPANSTLDANRGLNLLLDPGVRKVAIANPAHAPYGQGAVAALKSAGIYDKVMEKLVFGENVSQAAQFVASGNADAGLIALSIAVSPAIKSKGRYFLVPEDSYPPLEQAGIILKSSANKETARCFMDFLRSPEIVGLMEQYGFEPAGGKNAAKSGGQARKPCPCCRRSIANASR